MELPGGFIVVCDDSPTIRSVIGALLRPHYEVLELESAEAVLLEVARRVPDLILSDVEMDGISGHQLCARLKGDALLARVPVVLLTSHTDEESTVTGLASGADEYLFKPVRPRELLARVESLLRLRRATLQLEARTTDLERVNARLQSIQASLVEAEKLASLGTLVAGLAHELNNPLAYVRSGANFILAESATTTGPGTSAALTEIHEAAAEVVEGVARISRIVEDLSVTARLQAHDPEAVELAAELHAAWASTNDGCKAELSLELSAGSTTVTTVREQFGRVLRVVLENAAEAMKGHPGAVRVRAFAAETDTCIVIHDEGDGISPAHLRRVMDPFFTTKPPGQGTGMGLSVAHGLMRNLGGSIAVTSNPGCGAEVVLRLPLKPPSHYPRMAAL